MDRDLKIRIITENSKDTENKLTTKPKDYIAKKADASASCSDDWEIFVKFNNDKIESIKYMGNGCAISNASINIFSKVLVGKTKHEALKLLHTYEKLIITGEGDIKDLGELIVFDNVHTLVNRIECGLLGAKALIKIMEG